ncbi:hypothetical protein ACFWVT_25665 [Streptomyces cyaneofuscatus]|uniref:hypothetical protein n=1 Tax=Streptomyces cyaneofuscatus TaxID=66883 RepID=UPI00364F8B66
MSPLDLTGSDALESAAAVLAVPPTSTTELKRTANAVAVAVEILRVRTVTDTPTVRKGPRVTRDERKKSWGAARIAEQCTPLTTGRTFRAPGRLRAPARARSRGLRIGRGTRGALIPYSISHDWAPLFDESILRDAKTFLHFPAGKRDAIGPISPGFLGSSVRNVLRTHEGFRETVNGSEAAASHRKSVSDEAQNS